MFYLDLIPFCCCKKVLYICVNMSMKPWLSTFVKCIIHSLSWDDSLSLVEIFQIFKVCHAISLRFFYCFEFFYLFPLSSIQHKARKERKTRLFTSASWWLMICNLRHGGMWKAALCMAMSTLQTCCSFFLLWRRKAT